MKYSWRKGIYWIYLNQCFGFRNTFLFMSFYIYISPPPNLAAPIPKTLLGRGRIFPSIGGYLSVSRCNSAIYNFRKEQARLMHRASNWRSPANHPPINHPPTQKKPNKTGKNQLSPCPGGQIDAELVSEGGSAPPTLPVSYMYPVDSNLCERLPVTNSSLGEYMGDARALESSAFL